MAWRWIEITCSLAGEPLTEAEQAQYFSEGDYEELCSRP